MLSYTIAWFFVSVPVDSETGSERGVTPTPKKVTHRRRESRSMAAKSL